MPADQRIVYVVSDLHIGGAYASDPAGGRGFRICTRVAELTRFVQAVAARSSPGGARTELVINGDFVDFLAEAWPTEPRWRPFIEDDGAAAARLGDIVARDRPLFSALGDLLEAGHRLTILLGNHDVELSFPAVRRVLEQALGVRPGHDLAFIYDGEAYAVGRALIEHGNRYDGFNVIDHDGLRRHRSAQSRRQAVPEDMRFRVPPGSNIVTHIMNPVKERWPFVDLLKPESTACIPLLLALAPGSRREIQPFLPLALEAKQRDPGPDAMPMFAGDISAGPAVRQDPLRDVLGAVLGDSDAVDAFLADIDDSASAALDTSGDISFGSGLSAARGWVGLLLGRESKPLSTRLPSLLRALRALHSDTSFDRRVEGQSCYQDAAQVLLCRDFDVVVFGHTHLAKQVELPGGRYLNTGTWADLMRFPPELLTAPGDEALARVADICADLEARQLDDYIVFVPTFARITLAPGGEVLSAELRDWTGPDSL